MTRYIFCPKCANRALRIKSEGYKDGRVHYVTNFGIYCSKCSLVEYKPEVEIKEFIQVDNM